MITVSSFSQNFKEEKRIYLLDITGSMWGLDGGEKIFDDVKNSLIYTINSLENPETDITIITFGKGVEDTWKAKASPKGKSELIDKINSYSEDEYEGKNTQIATNICDALKAAEKEIDPIMFNYLFLYTDGVHNYPSSSLQCVKNIVQNICVKKDGVIDVYPFYIMLTKKASSSELRKALGCFTIIDGCSTPDVVIIKSEKNRTSINLLENKLSTEIRFVSNRSSSLPDKIKLILTLSENENFKLKETIYYLSENLGKITIDLLPIRNLSTIKSNLPLKSELKIKFSIGYLEKVNDCQTVEIRPENIIIDVLNKQEKTVTISLTEN
jgi:hypothetical protein